jgi:hypothetical protein
MQVLVAAARSAFAIAVPLMFVDESKANPVPIEETAGVIQMTGTVEALVVPTRLITVVGPQGHTLVALISPDVKHIEKIKLRETVTISFTEEVATALRKSDAPPATKEEGLVAEEEAGMDMNAPTVAEQDWVEITPKGASDLTTVEVTDTISAINRQ